MLAFSWMHTFEKIGNGAASFARRRSASPTKAWALAGFISLGAMLSGCASPGPPLPPSLKLPKIVGDLTAERIGDQVVLHWTTPDQTTDGLDIKGLVTADICRELFGAPPTPANSQPKPAACSAVLHRTVQLGPSEAVDNLTTALPGPLNVGQPRLLAYRVQLRNAAGRTAGPSAIAYSVSGASVPAIEQLRIRPTKAGALLEWKPDPAILSGDSTGERMFVDLERTTLTPPATKTSSSQGKPNASTAPKQVPPAHLRASSTRGAGASGSAPDPGGTFDETAKVGQSYSYTAQRVRTTVLGNRTFELRSEVSSPVKVDMTDTFPPDAPTGLVAVPGFVAPEANRIQSPPPALVASRPTIDLSWQPSIGERLAGYRVYRSEVQSVAADSSPLSRITSSLVPTAAYRDLAVEAGHTYLYRVTAVDSVGNESTPSDPATETAPAQ